MGFVFHTQYTPSKSQVITNIYSPFSKFQPGHPSGEVLAPPKFSMEPETEVPRKGSSSWKPSFSGSMLNFGGVFIGLSYPIRAPTGHPRNSLLPWSHSPRSALSAPRDALRTVENTWIWRNGPWRINLKIQVSQIFAQSNMSFWCDCLGCA